MLASSYSQRHSPDTPPVVYPTDSFTNTHITSPDFAPVLPSHLPPIRPKSAIPAYPSLSQTLQGHASYPPSTYGSLSSQSTSLGRTSGRRAKTPSHQPLTTHSSLPQSLFPHHINTPDRSTPTPVAAPASQTKHYERWLPPSPAPSHTHAPSGRALYSSHSSKRRDESTTPTPILGSTSTSSNSNSRRRTGSSVGVAMASLVNNLGASSIQRASTAAPPSYHHESELGSELPAYSYTKPPIPPLPEGVGATRMRGKLSGGGLSTASAAAAAAMSVRVGQADRDDRHGRSGNSDEYSTIRDGWRSHSRVDYSPSALPIPPPKLGLPQRSSTTTPSIHDTGRHKNVHHQHSNSYPPHPHDKYAIYHPPAAVPPIPPPQVDENEQSSDPFIHPALGWWPDKPTPTLLWDLSSPLPPTYSKRSFTRAELALSPFSPPLRRLRLSIGAPGPQNPRPPIFEIRGPSAGYGQSHGGTNGEPGMITLKSLLESLGTLVRTKRVSLDMFRALPYEMKVRAARAAAARTGAPIPAIALQPSVSGVKVLESFVCGRELRERGEEWMESDTALLVVDLLGDENMFWGMVLRGEPDEWALMTIRRR